MDSKIKEELTFVDALIGLIFEPNETTGLLFQADYPRFSFALFFCLFLTVLGPVVGQFYYYRSVVYNIDVLTSLAIVIVFTILVFILLEGILLALVGIEFSALRLFCCICYSLTPLIFAIWIVYGFNYLATGRLSLLNLLISGYTDVDDRFFRVLPTAFLLGQIWVVVVFFHSLKHMAAITAVSAFILTIFSLIPFYGSVICALFVGEHARTGTIPIFLKIFVSPETLTYFQ